MNCLTFSNFSFTILYNIFRIFASEFYVFFLIQNNSNNFNYYELSENWCWSADGKKWYIMYTLKKIQNILKILNYLKTSGSNKVVNSIVTSIKWNILYTQKKG